MSGLTPENANPRLRRTPIRLPVVLTSVLLIPFLSVNPLLQTSKDPDRTGVQEADEQMDQQRSDHEDPPATAGGPAGNPQDKPYDEAYLNKKRVRINKLLEQRQFSDAQARAYRVRKQFEDVEDPDLKDQCIDLYNDVLSRVKEAYKDVRDQADRYNDAGQPYRAYKFVRNEAKHFKGTAPWHRRLQRYLRNLKPDVVEAYRNGQLNERPDFFLGQNPEATNSSGTGQDTGRTRSRTPTGDPETDSAMSEEGPDSRVSDPRINASVPSMSNAPGSPKAFEGDVVETTENGVYFEVDFNGANSRQKMGYFLFELKGLKGRQNVRIDLKNMGRWGNSKTIAPMYSMGVEYLSDLTMMESTAPKNGAVQHVKTRHGQIVPKTRGLQKWHYFRNVTVREDKQTLTIRKRFPNEMTHTYIAHRVPYTYRFHRAYMNKLKERTDYGAEGLTVHEFGETAHGRPLNVIVLENPTDPEAKEKPVVIYGSGEHPDEMDTYLSMKGALDFLLSDKQQAKRLRRKATYIFVPAMDPDGLARCMYENICYSFKTEGGFVPGGVSETSKSLVKWFREWANDGRRLDVFILTHNVESGETDKHLFNYLVEPKGARDKMSMSIWEHVHKGMKQAGYRVDPSPNGTGYVPNRLGGFLKRWMATMQVFVELNSQAKAPGKKLLLQQIQNEGRFLVTSVVDYLYTDKAAPLLKDIRKKRQDRRKLVKRYEWYIDKEDTFIFWNNAIKTEEKMWFLPSREEYVVKWREKLKHKVDYKPMDLDLVEKLYEKPGLSERNIPEIDF